MENIIECDNITHYYGDRLIYKNLSFDVERGKILGLLGKNGTGKTTIINIVNGYLRPSGGVCRVFGEDIRTINPQTKARIGLQLEGHIQHGYFNVRQIERFYSEFYPRWNADAYYDLIKRLQITERQKISTMSCGQRSQVALGLLFAQDPELLILDDFSMGLDPGYRRLFIQYLQEFVRQGNKTVFLTSHIIQDMEMLIDDCLIFDYGRVLIHKPTKEILNDFRRYTFRCEAEITENDFERFGKDTFRHPERIGDRWEVYSFLPLYEVAGMLSCFATTELHEDKLTLEDAFIGLTGKY